MKKIFDVYNFDEIIINYSYAQINDLCKLLNSNKILCKEEDFISYYYVRINKKRIIGLSNMQPINIFAPIIDYKKVIRDLSD